MAQDKLSILIQALLDVSNSQEAVNKGVKELQKNAPKINIKANIDKESVLWDKTLGEDLKTLERKIKIFTNEQGQLVKETKFFAQEVNGAGESYTVLKKKTEEIISDYKKLRQELEKQDKLEKNIAMTVANKIRDLQTQATILKTNYEQGDFSQLDKFTSQLEKQRFTSENYKNILNELSNEYKKLASSVKESHAANVTATKDQEKQITQYNKLSNELKKLQNNAQSTNTILKNFGGKEYHIKADDLTNSLNKLNISQDMTQKEMEETIAKARQLSNSLNNVSKEAKATGNNSMTFGKMLSTAAEKFTIWIGVTTIFFATVRAIKSGIDSIIELDDALVELRKVTNLTSGDLKTFTNQASEVAERVARTTAEVTKATAMFARMGFTVQESLNLAEWANVLTNVGDGINSVEDASTTIISTLKGFGMEASNVQKIIDSLNEVSNNFALNTSDLSEGIRRVSATLSSVGNTFDETIGLLTAAIEVVQNAPRAATGIRTIALRLRGVTEEGEEIAELVPKLEKNFQKFGITLKKSNDQFKSTYEILQDLAKVRNKMSDFEFAEISELVSGKRQSDILNAILMNINSATAAMETSANSFGSALKEQEAYLDSITAKTNKFKQVTQDMWQNTISSDIIKFFVDLGTESIKVTDKIGLLNVALVALAAFLSTKYPAVFTMLLTKMGLIVASADGMAVAFNGVTMSATAMNAVLTLGIGAAIIGVIVGIKALAEAHDNYIKKLNENIEAIEKSIQQNEQESQSLNQLAEEYNKLLSKAEKTIEEKQRLSELNEELIKTYPELNTYVDTEGKLLYITADALREANEQRKETLRLQKEQLINDRKAIIEAERNALSRQMFGINFFSGVGSNLAGQVKGIIQKEYFDLYEKSLSNMISELKLLQNDILSIEKGVGSVSSFSETIILKLSDSFTNEFAPSVAMGKMSIDEFTNQWRNLIQELNSGNANRALNQYDRAFNNKNIEAIKVSYQQLDTIIRNASGGLIGLVDIFGSLDDVLNNLNQQQLKNIPSVEELTKAYEKATDAIDDYQSSAKKLSDIFNTINEDGKISADNILDLIQKYPQLASEIANMNSSKEAGMKLTKQLFELEKANSIIELRNNKAILDSKLSLLEIDEKKYKLAREIAAQNKDGEGVIQATKALMALGNIKELRDQSKSIEEAIGVITGLSIDDFKSKTSGGVSSVSKTLTQQQLVDQSKLTEAFIKSANEAYEITKAQEKLLNIQIKNAEKAKDYNKELELTNKLIENQQSQVEQLQTANENIHKRANELRATVPETDTTKWFTSTGEFTSAYDNLMIEFANRKNEIIADMNVLEEKTGLEKAEEQQYKNLQNKLKSIETEQKKTEDLASALQSLKRAYTDNAEAIQTLDDSLTASAQKIVDINKSIYDAQLDELKSQYNLGELTTKQYYEALIKLSKEYSDFLQTNDKDAWNSILLEIKNTSEKITKEYEDLQKDVINILKKRYDQEEKLRKDQHDILLRQLDDEKKAYQDYINSRIEEIDRLYATEDYRNTIGERTQAITDIQSEISKYSLASANGDIEAISKIATLQEQLAEEEKKLAEEQNKRERDLRKQSLQDSLKDFENYIDDKKRVEEDSFNEFKQNIEKATNETALQIEAQKLLMQNSIQDAQSSLLKLFEETGINASETGKILQDEIINRLLQIRDLEKQVKSIAPKKSDLNYGSIPGYTNGGINTTTGLAMLHGTSSRPEWILNTEQMKKLVNGLAFGNIVSKFNTPQISSNKNVAGGINLGGIVINAQKVDENSIPQLVKEVAKVFERKLNLAGIPT